MGNSTLLKIMAAACYGVAYMTLITLLHDHYPTMIREFIFDIAGQGEFAFWAATHLHTLFVNSFFAALLATPLFLFVRGIALRYCLIAIAAASIHLLVTMVNHSIALQMPAFIVSVFISSFMPICFDFLVATKFAERGSA